MAEVNKSEFSENSDIRVCCERIQDILVSKGMTLSTAESCTGGRIASAITAIPGASEYFISSLVAYQNEVKERLLGVHHSVIEEHDVVSKEVVTEMLKGACALFGTDYAITTSGCAGPGGGSESIPVGTIWIAYGKPTDIQTFCCKEDLGRLTNIENAVSVALRKFLQYLESNEK